MRVLIVGGGVAGLTLAALLRQRDHEPQAVEKADAHLQTYFPELVSHGQLNQRIRAVGPELRCLQQALAVTTQQTSKQAKTRAWMEAYPCASERIRGERPVHSAEGQASCHRKT